MAEFMRGKAKPCRELQGLERMGHPIDFIARQRAYEHCVAMGLTA